MKVANSLYNSAPKDGTVLGIFSSSVAMVPLYGKRKAKFVTDKFEWISSLHRDIQACGVWKGAGQGIKTLPNPLSILPLWITRQVDSVLRFSMGNLTFALPGKAQVFLRFFLINTGARLQHFGIDTNCPGVMLTHHGFSRLFH